MKRQWFLTGALMAGGSALARTIDIQGTGQGKVGINFSRFKTGSDATSRTFLAVLKADLARSGYFSLSSSGGTISVLGQAVSGGQVQADIHVYKTATKEKKLGKRYSASAASVRGLAHKVADEILYAVTGKKGMASAKIAVVGTRTGRKELYICDIDGKQMRQITKDRSIVVGPRWTPDGKNLTYTSYKRGYPNVFVTGRRDPITRYGGLNASGAISPDGKYMAVILSKSGNPELWLVSARSGKLVRRLSSTQRGNEASPCWSPDGQYIAYVSDVSGRPNIYIISKNGGRPQRLTSSGTENVAPSWGKNGYIAFCTRSGGRYRIAIAHPKQKTMRLLETDWADYEDPSWAPDGRHIVCSRTSNYRSSIYLLDTLKDSPVALISGSGDWYSPAVSP